MNPQKEVKRRLLTALGEVLDRPLNERDFARKENLLSYSRRLSQAEQQIVFAVDYLPSCQPGAETHIHPNLQLLMPQVSSVALSLVNGDASLLAGAPGIIVNQPIEFTAPKKMHERWFASTAEQFVTCCQSIKSFLWRWTLPFLAELSSPADLARLYEVNDTRLMKQQHCYIFIAAAYELLGRRDKAREIVRHHFSSVGLRKRYAPLLASLQIQ